jgi:hypothetical protein
MRPRWLAMSTALVVVAAAVGAIASRAGADSQTTTNAPYTCTTNGFGNQSGAYGATVSDTVNPAQPGDVETYRFVSPFDEAAPPISATYKGGQTWYRIPAGLAVASVSTQTPPGDTTIQSTAAVQGDSVVVTTTANQPIDGASHPTPDLLVTGTVLDSARGPGVVWQVPYHQTATVSTQAVGTVDADCTPDDPTIVIKKTTVPALQAPVPGNQSIAVPVGGSKAITLTATDADSPQSSLVFAVATQPAHGSLSGTVSNMTYTPSATYTGLDAFTFTVTDDTNLTATGTISINVFSNTVVDNTPPTVSVAAPANGAVYTPGQAVDASFGCADATTGIKSCTGTVADGAPIDTTTGEHTFTVDALDNADNPARATVSYRVIDPAPVPQPYDAVVPTSGSTANEIPTDCGELVRTAETDIPTLTSAAPAAGTGRSFTFRVALGEQEVPVATTATNIVYSFAAPSNGAARSASIVGGTGSANARGSASVAVTGGKIVVTVAGPIAGGATAATPFTPPTFDVTIASGPTAGAVVQTQFDHFAEHLAVGPLTSDKSCTGGDAHDNEVNPVLSRTTIVDTTPPTVALTTPANGAVYLTGDHVIASFSCTDDHAASTCIGSGADGSALETSTTGIKSFVVTATDAAGNVAQRFASFTVKPATVTYTAHFPLASASALYSTAVYLHTTPGALPGLGVSLLRYLVAISPNPPGPVVPPPASTGEIALPTTYPQASVPAILDLAGKFVLDGDQLHVLGTQLLIYIVAISPH